MNTKGVFRRLSNRMLEDFNISAEINHQGSRGTYRESTLKRFLADGRLPSRYGIGTSEIVGHVHNVSRQSDLIIYDQLNGISLIYDQNTQVFPIECVAGIVEVKSTLNKTKFLESLENIKSVKKLAPRETTTKRMSGISVSYPRPIPFGAIFGYRLAGNSLDSLLDNLREWERDTPKEYWPNVVAVLDEGLIQHYGSGLRIAYINSDLREAAFPSAIHYRADSLFKFYSILIDLCSSTDLGPVDSTILESGNVTHPKNTGLTLSRSLTKDLSSIMEAASESPTSIATLGRRHFPRPSITEGIVCSSFIRFLLIFAHQLILARSCYADILTKRSNSVNT